MLCLLMQLVRVISINVQTDDVSIKSGCVTESLTVHLETMNCPLSAVRFLFFFTDHKLQTNADSCTLT